MSTSDYFSTYFDFVETNTESPMIFHRWCAVSAIASCLGRNVSFRNGHHTVYPNQYIMLIGSPGTRKSTAIDISKRLLRDSGYDTFAPSKCSKEKFLADLAEGYGSQNTSKPDHKYGDYSLDEPIAGLGDPREVTICSGEFNSFIGHNNFEFIALLGDLWDNLERFEVRNRTTSDSFVHKPTVNLLGGNTQTNFATAFPPEIIGQGFMSRLILIYCPEARQKIPFPDEPDAVLQMRLIEWLGKIRKLKGEVTLTPEAREIMAMLYQQDRFVDDARFIYYENRRFDHLIKMSICCAAARLSLEITAADVLYANSILVYAEQFMPKALGEFGKSKFSDLHNKIMALLEEIGPMDATALFKKLMQDCDGLKDVMDSLANLKQAERIKPSLKGVGKFEIVKRKVSENSVFNPELLREYVGPATQPQKLAVAR